MNTTTQIKILIFTITLAFCNFQSVVYGQNRATGDTESKAEKLFKNGEYTEAQKLYSNLVALYPKDPLYNYRYGACILYSEPEKSQALKYLNFAAATSNPPVEAYYFAGIGYHYNYRFVEALKYYSTFQSNAKNRELKKYPVERQIRMAKNGKDLLKNIAEPQVKNQTQTSTSDFHLSYKTLGSDHKFLRMLSEFRTKTDEDRNYFGLMYKHAAHNEIWFASYGADEASGTDLYKILISEDGSFQKPQKLPAAVNTGYDDAYPFFNYTTQTLYFASKGHSSMGGFDLFKIAYDTNTDTWGKAQNLDFAYNTPDDDILYAESESTAFFTSSRNNNQGRVTVYEINPDQNELKSALIAGTFNHELYKKVDVTVTKLPENEVIATFESDEKTGRYNIVLPGNSKYEFAVKPAGSSLSHMGEVRIPKVTGAAPLLQTMSIIQKNDEEHLIINNKFDQRDADDEMMADYFAQMANLRKSGSPQKSIAQTDGEIIQAIEKEISEKNKRSQTLTNEAQKATSLAASKLLKATELQSQLSADSGNSEKQQQYTEALAQSDAAAHYALHLQNEVEGENKKVRDLEKRLKKAQTYAKAGNRDQTVQTFLAYQKDYSKKGQKEPTEQAYLNYLKSAEEFESEAAGNRNKTTSLRSEKADLEAQLNFIEGEKKRTRKKREREELQAEINRLTEDIVFLDEQIDQLQKQENLKNSVAEHMTLRAQMVKNMREEIQNTTANEEDASPSKILAETENTIRAHINKSKTHTFNRPETKDSTLAQNTGSALNNSNSQNPQTDENTNTPETPESDVTGQEEKTALLDSESENDAQNVADAPKPRENQESKTQTDAETETEIAAREDDPEMSEFEKMRAEKIASRENEQLYENSSEPAEAEKPATHNKTSDSTEKLLAQDTDSATDTNTDSATEYQDGFDENEYIESPENDTNSRDQPNSSTPKDLKYDQPEYEAFYERAEDDIAEIENTTARALASLELKKQQLEKTEKEAEILREKRAQADEVQRQIINDRLAELEEKKTGITESIQTAENDFQSGRKRNKDFAPGEEYQNSFTIQDIEDKYFFEYETLNEENPRDEMQSSISITENYIAELNETREKLVARLKTLPEDKRNYDKVKKEISTIEEVIQLKQDQINYNQKLLSLAQTPQYTKRVEVIIPESAPELATDTRPEKEEQQEREKKTPQNREKPVKSDNLQKDTSGQSQNQNTATEKGMPSNQAVTDGIGEFEAQLQESYSKLETAETKLEVAQAELENAKRRKRKQAQLNVNNAEAEVKSAKLQVYMDSLLLNSAQKLPGRADDAPLPSQQFADSARMAKENAQKAYEQGVTLRNADDQEESLTQMNLSREFTKKSDEFTKLAEVLAALESQSNTGSRPEKSTKESDVPENRLLAWDADKKLSNNDKKTAEKQEAFKQYQKAQTRFSLTLRQASVMYEDARDMELKGARLNAAARKQKGEGASEAEITALQEEADYLMSQAEKQKNKAANKRKKAIVEYNIARQQLLASASDHKDKMVALAAEQDEPFEKLASTPLPALNSQESFAKQPEIDDTELAAAEKNDREEPREIPEQVTETPRERPDDETARTDSQPADRGTDYLVDEPSRPTDLTRTSRAVESAFTTEPEQTAERTSPVALLQENDEITYRVQVAAFSERVSNDYFPFGPMAGEQLPNGIIRYLAGNFDNRNEAETARDAIRAAGYNDAFVVAYRGDSKLTLAEAAAATPAKTRTLASESERNQARQNTERGSEVELDAQTIAPETVNNADLIEIGDVQSRGSLFFTVQVGAYSDQTPVSDLPSFSPMNKDDLGNGIVRYSTGVFSKLDAAVQSKNKIRNAVPDAFVTAYYNGRRITVERALELGSDQKEETTPKKQQVRTETPTRENEETKRTEPETEVSQRSQEAPRGTTPGQFTVEVGPYDGKVPVNEARQILQLSSRGVNIQKADAATYYQIGTFDDEEDAEKLAKELRRKGISEARVIEFNK